MGKRVLYIIIILGIIRVFARAQAPGSSIDVQHYTFAIQLNDENNSIKGEANVDVKFLKNSSNFSLNLVKKNSKGKGMLVSEIKENGKSIRFMQDSDVVNIYADAKANTQHNFTISYSGIPADGLIISTNMFGKRTFFGDNWPNRAHNWLPCVDDLADKASLDFIVTAPSHYDVVSNGLKVEEKLLPNSLKLTHWKETALLPPKVMVIGVADFAIENAGEPDGIPVYTYVFPENKAEGFKSYAVANEILPFYISKIGPFAYKKLANVQSKTIFGGMENAGAIFYFEESVTDDSIEALMAHEIAHQWFGDAASEKSWQNLWLSEGFATYMTNYYIENKHGADTFKRRMAADRRKVIAFEKTRMTPVVDSAVKSNYMQLLNANSYEKGSWTLHMLRNKLGEDDFWKGVRNYFAKYDGGNANTDDFRKVMEQASGQNLEVFFKQWLLTAGHPLLKIDESVDSTNSFLIVKITQKQSKLYTMPLEISVNGKIQIVDLKDRETIVKIPNTSAHLEFDPNVKLLASFDISHTGKNIED